MSCWNLKQRRDSLSARHGTIVATVSLFQSPVSRIEVQSEGERKVGILIKIAAFQCLETIKDRYTCTLSYTSQPSHFS